MSAQIQNERRFTDKTEEVVKENYQSNKFPEGLNGVFFQVLDPIKSLCDLVLMNDTR